MKNKLTTRYIQEINHTPEKLERHWDTELKRLLLQVSKAGTRTFYYRYSITPTLPPHKHEKWLKLKLVKWQEEWTFSKPKQQAHQFIVCCSVLTDKK